MTTEPPIAAATRNPMITPGAKNTSEEPEMIPMRPGTTTKPRVTHISGFSFTP